MLEWFKKFFNQPIDKIQTGVIHRQAVFYQGKDGAYINLDSSVGLLVMRSDGVIYGTTVVNGVIYFCKQIYPCTWQVCSQEETEAIGKSLENTKKRGGN